MEISEIKVKNIISKSKLPGADFVINPYIGCQHKCIYCYARFMQRFSNHTEPWFEFLDIKINAPELVPNKISKYTNKKILLSSVTDPYLPAENTYKLTRKILGKLIPHQPDLSILTKSDLVLRDIDFLTQFKKCSVGITITTLDDFIRKEIEPGASSIENRINALQKLKTANLETYVFIGPILPEFTDWKKIIEATQTFTDFYYFENLNISGSIWFSIKNWLKNYHPNLIQTYEKVYFTKNDYWNKIENEIKQFCDQKNLNYKICFHH